MEKTSFRSRSYNQKSKTKNSCTRELLVCKFQALTFSRRFDTFDVAVSRRGLFTKSSSREKIMSEVAKL